MEQVRTSERRSGRDRRTAGTYLYTGPERRTLKHRRSGFDRRNGLTAFCIYCGEVCSPPAMEISVGRRTGICPDCCSNWFPQFYTDS